MFKRKTVKLETVALLQFTCVAEVGPEDNRYFIRFGIISTGIKDAEEQVENMFKADKFLSKYNVAIVQLSLTAERVEKREETHTEKELKKLHNKKNHEEKEKVQ